MTAPRLERCPRCDAPRWFEAHPAGWKCPDCRLCVTAFQTPLTAFKD